MQTLPTFPRHKSKLTHELKTPFNANHAKTDTIQLTLRHTLIEDPPRFLKDWYYKFNNCYLQSLLSSYIAFVTNQSIAVTLQTRKHTTFTNGKLQRKRHVNKLSLWLCTLRLDLICIMKKKVFGPKQSLLWLKRN